MEQEFIRWLRQRVADDGRLTVPLGDDAAVLRLAQRADCVLAVDMITDQVDFDLATVDPRRIGRKALAVNLSDLAAMAARPVACLVALALPRQGALALAQELLEGMIPLVAQYELMIAGGDTNTWNGPLAISVTVVGETTGAQPLVRKGARPGDAIVVTGQFGGSILGRQFTFEPRVTEALLLAEHYPLHAGIDVSDGLSLDLARLAEASGCGALVDLERVPIAPAARTLAEQLQDGATPLDHALTDGEDFELILAMPAAAADELLAVQPLACGCTRIGTMIAEPGLWQVDGVGGRRPLAARGYLHGGDP
ncbi:MAG: thiamine-monophosphate kinase [Pirellulales bacterium]